MKELIQEALVKLDPTNDDHWTNEGLPRIDKLGIAGLKRGDITAAAPQFTRENPSLDLPPLGNETQDQAAAADQDIQPSTKATDPETSAQDELPVLPDEDPELVAMKQKYLEAEKEAEAADKAVNDAKIVLDKKRQIADALGNQLQAMMPKEAAAHNIRHYIDTQNALRLQRAEQHNAYLKSIGQKPLGSKLDQAMASKRGYGLQRPKVEFYGKD